MSIGTASVCLYSISIAKVPPASHSSAASDTKTYSQHAPHPLRRLPRRRGVPRGERGRQRAAAARVGAGAVGAVGGVGAHMRRVLRGACSRTPGQAGVRK